MRIPSKDFPRFQGVETLNKDMADNADIRRAIIKAVPTANKQVGDFAKHFGRNSQRETCKAIFDFLKKNIRYVADGSEQVIKLPSALLETKVGDCKSYSLLTSAILTNIGIPHHFVMTSYNADPTPSHIYVETSDGCIIDAVWGIFDSEKQPTYRYEIKPNGMKVKTMSGVGIGNPALIKTGMRLAPLAIAVTPQIIEAYHRAKRSTKKDKGMDGCGCSSMKGIGCASCGGTCGGAKPVGLGAFELDAASKAYCDKTYPVTKTWFGDTNKILREGCYARERVADQVADLNLKKFINAPFRALYLSLIQLNVDGIASDIDKNPSEKIALGKKFQSYGGDGNSFFQAVTRGASKKPFKLGFIDIIKNKINSVIPKGIKINGIGATSDTMTPEEEKIFYRELIDMGLTAKKWNQMSKDEKSIYIAKKLMSGLIGNTIRGTLDTAGAGVATAVCAPANIAAAACSPAGALIGEAMFSQIPEIVKMVVKSDSKYDPIADSGETPPPAQAGSYGGDATPPENDNTLLYLVGASIAGYLIYQSTKK
jgi:hypothetical protein